MSLHAITSSIAQTGLLPQVNFGGSPKKKSNAADAAGSDASSIGQIPVGTGQNLLANALHALEQAVGAQSAATAAGGGAATASTAQLTACLNGLLQKIQSNGAQAPSLLGAHVNATV
jgi:hypothetical protein